MVTSGARPVNLPLYKLSRDDLRRSLTEKHAPTAAVMPGDVHCRTTQLELVRVLLLRCRDAAKIDRNRMATLTRLRRVVRACKSAPQKCSSARLKQFTRYRPPLSKRQWSAPRLLSQPVVSCRQVLRLESIRNGRPIGNDCGKQTWSYLTHCEFTSTATPLMPPRRERRA